MTHQEFLAAASAGYNRIPVSLTTLADLDTPLSVYLKLANKPFTYLLESVIGGERFGRYSFIGLKASEVISARGRSVAVSRNGVIGEAHGDTDPLAFIAAYMKRFNVAPLKAELRFPGGLAGYFAYDVVRHIEPKLAGVNKPDPLGVPDILLVLAEELAIVDNVMGRLHLVVFADPSEATAYERAVARLDELRKRLGGQLDIPALQPAAAPGEAKSEIGEAAFLAAVEKSKRYIVEGDIMQVQISQRVAQPFAAPPVNLYRALRSINPSPYMYYFDFGDFHVVGASPEILVRKEGNNVTVRPIAGTRRRGRTPEEDVALEQELLSDPKERAEHLMLIDLGRNDVGRVAKIGSVKVTEAYVVERYSHVMHIVSNVEAELRHDVDTLELLRATFPAGTVTGTPKVRAMQIIDELEPTKRGVYAGAAGYLGFNGNMDLAIAIRTAIVKNRTLYAQAAAGVVADSVPALEWKETRNKLRALMRAAEMASSGLSIEEA